MLTRAEFLQYLREALNHLYDPNRLHQSPLADLFGVARRSDAASALQRILTDSITALQPETSTPAQQRAWRIYDLLFYRYVEQHTVQTVADQLGLTARHLRREQNAALESLAYRLWQQFNLDEKANRERSAAALPQAPNTGPTVSEELNWLKATWPEEPTNLNQVLPIVLEEMQPLATQHAVHLEVKSEEGHIMLAAHQVAVTQMLVNLISVAIPRAAHGQISISARQHDGYGQVNVRCVKTPTGHGGANDMERLDMARQLVALSRGWLSIADDEKVFKSVVSIPALGQLRVLAIDDNADTLQLFGHYTAGTCYTVTGTRDPDQALPIAEELKPKIIVLDVMMPRVDGWRVLAQLRQHPLTSHIPIIVCTILPQEDMALSLGASGFVRKPISQEAFLAALDQQVAAASESH